MKVKKLKSLRTHVPKVNNPKPATNIIKAANLYRVASEPLLNKKVSAAKEFDGDTISGAAFLLDDENIFI